MQRNYFASLFTDQPILVDGGSMSMVESYLTMLSTDDNVSTLVKSSSSETYWLASDDWRSQYQPYNVRDGVLIIPVSGVLLSDMPWCVAPYATGYKYLTEAFKRGLEDDGVNSIVFMINSPGGHVNENLDFVDMIYANRGIKPINALVFNSACSAAYGIASAADKIVTSRTAILGSIGVVMCHFDYSEALKSAGVKVTYIYEGPSKVDGNPNEPLGDSVKARWHAQVSTLYSEFTSTVARNRGINETDIIAMKSLTFTAAEAVSNGLADSIATLEDAMTGLSVAETAIIEGDETMSKTDESVAKAEHDTLIAAATTSGFTAGKAEGEVSGASAERTRMKAIMESPEGMSRPNAALGLVLESDMSAESASKFLLRLEPEAKASAESPKGNPVALAALNASGGANVEAGDSGGEGGETNASDKADDVLNMAASFGLPGFRTKPKG